MNEHLNSFIHSIMLPQEQKSWEVHRNVAWLHVVVELSIPHTGLQPNKTCYSADKRRVIV